MRNFILNNALFLLSFENTTSVNYEPQVPETGKYQNRNLNPLGSGYAAQYGHNVTALIQRMTREVIFDSAPQQYFDLKILGMKTPETLTTDEFFYHEMGFGREPVVNNTIGVGGIAAGATQTIPILNKDTVHKDMIIVYPDGSRGTITSITPVGQGANIVVTAMSNSTLPAIPQSAAGSYLFSNLSSVEADGANSISQYVRYEPIERTNYIQMLIKAMRFGRMEMLKYQNNGTLTNYLTMQKQRMYQQFRISLANVYWNGKKGEVTLTNGQKAKTTGGVYTLMQEAGSPNFSASMALLPQAVEELALSTEYGMYGQTKFLYGTPRAILALSKAYKSNLTRYTPNDMIAKLNLNSIDIGSSKIVMVPVKRFEEPSCFPTSWRSKMILLDQENIIPCQVFPEESGETDDRNRGSLSNFVDTWISATFGIKFYNPLACGWIDITNLP